MGVSGGGDSMALLHAMHGAGLDCVAVTVDHRLRPGSTQEAEFAAAECAKLGVSHRTIARPDAADWRGSAAARVGRYAALLTVAVEVNAPVVTGHTLDDQAETLRMRARRGGGTLGLSGIPPVATLAGRTRLLRPLLGSTRSRLRTYLMDHGLPWVDDPTNENRRFERIRLRQDGEAGELRRVAQFADAARGYRAALMRTIAADLAANLQGVPDAWTYRPSLAGTALVHALRILVARAGRAEHWPSQARIAAFLAAEPALTIAGTIVRRKGGEFHLSPDPRRAASLRDEDPLARFRPESDDPVHAVLSRLR